MVCQLLPPRQLSLKEDSFNKDLISAHHPESASDMNMLTLADPQMTAKKIQAGLKGIEATLGLSPVRPQSHAVLLNG